MLHCRKGGCFGHEQRLDLLPYALLSICRIPCSETVHIGIELGATTAVAGPCAAPAAWPNPLPPAVTANATGGSSRRGALRVAGLGGGRQCMGGAAGRGLAGGRRRHCARKVCHGASVSCCRITFVARLEDQLDGRSSHTHVVIRDLRRWGGHGSSRELLEPPPALACTARRERPVFAATSSWSLSPSRACVTALRSRLTGSPQLC